MLIKLTRLDGSPIWIAANLVSAIRVDDENRAGISVAGDNYTWSVKEAPEVVAELVNDALPVERVASILHDLAIYPGLVELTRAAAAQLIADAPKRG